MNAARKADHKLEMAARAARRAQWAPAKPHTGPTARRPAGGIQEAHRRRTRAAAFGVSVARMFTGTDR